MTTEDEARAVEFASAADLDYYAGGMREEQMVVRWIEAGAPRLREAWELFDGVEPVDTLPLTLKQAAGRMNLSVKSVRRRLPSLASMEPPGAYRTSDSPRAPWRIIPAALDLLRTQTVEPEPARPPRRRPKSPSPKKRSATRWEA